MITKTFVILFFFQIIFYTVAIDFTKKSSSDRKLTWLSMQQKKNRKLDPAPLFIAKNIPDPKFHHEENRLEIKILKIL